MFVMSSHAFILLRTGKSGMSLAKLQYIYIYKNVLTIFLLYSCFSNLPEIFQALEVISAVIASPEVWEDWKEEAAAGSGDQAYQNLPALRALEQS